ncbi:LLM class flavin-dependent oxidoreductase [Nocardioides sp. CER19]|uniref:LLM class flavin-dependent oxidoreductase n=1 Tax=Nocardioides sp. CER19 TaxID=3038538 RepID=UPI00244BA45B|nr:LLM class flavin-dependent oxidoreductase [Nocardioides sp. CER19]MDH2416291.1 LLM class flavin-dependent oxidoreductase [Nocardioides sp. CER19]
MTRKHLVFALGLFYPNGEHVTSWRLPDARPERFLDFDYYRDLARTAERGRFAAIFLADELYVWDRFESGVESTVNERLEPFTLLGGLSQATEHIGLVATVSTTYNEPYHVARRLATLDHMSHGRAGWNLVTSASDEEAWNFGRDANLDHAVRYRRGGEFVEVVDRLLDSWDEGAVVADKASGRYADPAKVRPIHHHGEFFDVRGPLNISRSPQRRPALFQAGASEDGKNLAAATADAVFTLGSGTLDAAQDLYRDYKERVAVAGRDPESLAVMPMLAPVIGSTEAEARERADLILELTPDQVALDLLSHRLQTDLSGRDPDEIFTFDFLDEGTVQQSQSAYKAIQRLVEGRSLTLRQVYQAVAGRGFVVGTPEKIADRIEERFNGKAADGFILMAPSLPSGLADLVDHVVPLLTQRGIYPPEYAGATLRENLAGR